MELIVGIIFIGFMVLLCLFLGPRTRTYSRRPRTPRPPRTRHRRPSAAPRRPAHRPSQARRSPPPRNGGGNRSNGPRR